MAKKETARPLHESYQPFVKSLEEYTNAAALLASACGTILSMDLLPEAAAKILREKLDAFEAIR